MLQKIQNEIDSLPDNFIVGIVTKSDKYEKVNLHILNMMLHQKGHFGGYVAVNRPYKNMVELLTNQNMDFSNLFFIDCITQKLGGRITNDENCVYINSPSNLTDLAIALHNFAIAEVNAKKFLMIDSISTLLIHNDHETVQKFIHYLTGKIRLWGLKGVMITLHEETDEKLIAELSQFCDKIIRV
ncbi:hypothetical protein D6745_04375 [Candidatus Woesearchaeota archaeon]|nr:MAG: hypothetical protein D6745_04375 [Candidatus Woesearchaeota archaeon]